MFRDVTSPAEAYDLLLDDEVVGHVVRDESRLKGLPAKGNQWVLVQRDADYSLARESTDEAIEHARSIVAARLAATGENPSGPGPIQRKASRRVVGWLTAFVVTVAALFAFAVRTRRR